LGFVNHSSKYSDSYMAHYIVEKVGILNFWLALKDSSAGVFLIYDKVLEKAFLCKFSGMFEYSKFKNSTNVIYASSESDFWKVDETTRIDDGFYRLNEDGIDVLDKKKTYGYSGTGYSKYKNQYTGYGRTWDDVYAEVDKQEKKKKKSKKKKPPITIILEDKKDKLENDGIWKDIPYCYYCQETFVNDQPTKIDWGFKVCLSCFDEYGDSDGLETDAYGLEIITIDLEDPVGIATLFPDLVPKFCNECNWLY
ncbi:unnamed protein product, partial [marine sediment metagenome]